MNKILRTVILVCMIALLIFPIIPLLFYSLSTALGMSFPNIFPEEFTFDTLGYVWGTFHLDRVLFESLKLSLIVAIGALVLAYFPAKMIGTMDFKGKRLLELFLILPAIAPGIIIVFGMIRILAPLGLYKTYIGLVLVEMTFVIPYVIINMNSHFRNYDMNLEYQGRTLGLSNWSVLRHITIPQSKNSLAISFLFAFEISWSMYLIVSVIAPNGFETMATVVFNQINGLYTLNVQAALAVAFFVPALIVLIITTLIIGNDENKSGGSL